MSGTESGVANPASCSGSATAEQLVELAARCEQVMGPDRALDLAIGLTVPEPRPFSASTQQQRGGKPPGPRFTASLDAAMTLVEPDVFFHVSRFSPESEGRGQAHVYPNRGLGDDYGAEAATPALALCAAALRARASQ